MLTKKSMTLFIVTAVLVSMNSYATEKTNSLNLQQALKRSLENNIELKAFSYLHQQALAKIKQAKLKPLTELSLEVENIAGSGQKKGLEQAEITLSLNQTIELGDKRQFRQQFASTKAASEQIKFNITRLNVRAETHQRYYNMLRLQALASLLQKRIQQEKKALTKIQRRAKAAVVAQTDVSLLDLRLHKSLYQLQMIEYQKKISALQLANLWQQEPDFNKVSGSLKKLPSLPDKTYLLIHAKQSPIQQQYASLERLSQNKLALARSAATSDLTMGIGLRHFEQSNEQALAINLSMPLNFGQANAGNISAAESNQQLNVINTQWQQQQLQLSLIDHLLKMQQAQQSIDFINTSLLKKAKQLLNDTESEFNKGKSSILEWLEVENEVFQLEQTRIENSHFIFLQILELERLTGLNLFSSTGA